MLLRDFCFLQILTSLTSLVLDNNSVTSHTSFPYLPSLELLWVNGNKITNLALFIDKISTQFPNLRYLSMMKNDAAPSYFNGGTKQQYLDYRYVGISCTITHLFYYNVHIYYAYMYVNSYNVSTFMFM